MAGGIGDVAQGPLPGEYGQPVHRGPDGVLDATRNHMEKLIRAFIEAALA